MVAKVISQRKLSSLKLEWQKKLRLKDWTIKICYSPRELVQELTGCNAIGACDCFVEAKVAKIHVVKPRDEDGERSQDIENTVVHELLHCHFEAFQKAEPIVKLHIEQVIEILADALLAEKRGKKRGS